MRMPTGILKLKGNLSQAEVERFREEWIKASVNSAPLICGGDGEVVFIPFDQSMKKRLIRAYKTDIVFEHYKR